MVIEKYNLSKKYHKRIVHISDIHYKNKKNLKNLYKILKVIKNLKPDYICITGDIVDDKNIKDQQLLVDYIKDLSSICKIFISLGNHEFYYNHHLEKSYDKSLFDKVDRLKNVYVLDNKIHSEFGINFIGITLDNNYYDLESESEFLYFMNKKIPRLDCKYNILLLHSPYRIVDKKTIENLKCKNNISLVLSGHMHAGLTFEWMKKILKGRGLVTPQKEFFKNYCYGMFKINNYNVIITSGITKLSNLKLFNYLYQSEITVIDI